MDITMERDEELIKFGDLDLTSKVNAGLKLLNLSLTWLSALYLINKSGDFEYIRMDIT